MTELFRVFEGMIGRPKKKTEYSIEMIEFKEISDAKYYSRKTGFQE